MQQYAISPKEMLSSLWLHRHIIMQMSKRDAFGRYRGSLIGLAWSFFNPLLMLIVYTFVFSVVFKSRWGVDPNESRTDFALILFVGLTIHTLFADCINRAPLLITSNVNYVKKVIFPLEILPWVTLGSSIFQALINLLVLLIAQLFLNHYFPWTIIFFPIVLIPLVFVTMGFSWFLSSIGVYLRDVSQVTGIFTTVLLFMSGVFFPITSLPEQYQWWLQLNPLAALINCFRDILIFGQLPHFLSWSLLTGTGAMIAWAGFAWFQKTRKGFADVI